MSAMQTCTADTREPHVDSRWRTLAGCALVFVVMTWAYHRSPVLQLTDSLYSFLLAENLLDHQEIELDRYFPPQHSSRGYPEVAPGAELPRQMRRIDGHIYYYFPHGTAFLCLPLVAALRTKHSAVDASGGYDVQGAAWQQKWCAALVTAATCCVLFVCARLLLGMGASLLVALGAGFGTQLWSTASRAMTSHTLLVLLLAVSLLLILRERLGRGRPHLALVATLFSWSFFTRPLAVAFIVPRMYVWSDRTLCLGFGLHAKKATTTKDD